MMAASPRYFTAVTVSRGTVADGVRNSSLPTQIPNASLLCQRVIISTSSASSERSTSIETKPGKSRNAPLLLANISTTLSAAPSFIGMLLKIAIIETSRHLARDYDPAAAYAFCHAQSPKRRRNEAARIFAMLRVDRDSGVDRQGLWSLR